MHDLARPLPALCVAAIVALALASDAPHAEARCATRRLEIVVLTPLDRPLPRGAGILIALRPSASAREDATLPEAATIGSPTQAGGNIVLLETIAPGLARIPLGSTAAGAVSIRGVLDHEIALTVSATPLPSRPPAPDVASISVEQRGRIGTSAHATLRTPAPPEVIALVVTTASRTAPFAFALPSPRGAPDLVAYGRCVMRPADWRAPNAGESLVLRYVDRAGQLSPPSIAVTASAP